MKDKIIGFTTFEQYEESEKDAFLEMDKIAFEKGVSDTLEQISFPNGEVRSLHTIKTRFENAKGQAFILGTATDVTQREALISQLEKSNADLEQFAYVASHDLKSPLNAINKLVSWIEEDYGSEIPEGAQEHFTMIKKRAERLSTLLTDLLEYSRINQKLGEHESVNFGSLVNSIHLINDNSELFSISATECEVLLPKTALQIVLMNLVSNTIKHHDKKEGSIQIIVNDELHGYRISYLDDGPGIEEIYAVKVFQMFQTLKSRDKVEASGMGLALIKKILEYYSGTIRLIYENPENKGVHFEIFWPKVVLN